MPDSELAKDALDHEGLTLLWSSLHLPFNAKGRQVDCMFAQLTPPMPLIPGGQWSKTGSRDSQGLPRF